MNDRASPDEPLPTRTEAGEETMDLAESLDFFTTGEVLGERYEILEMLGRGGMGEVWLAFDLKLRVEVGLKALRDDLFQNERRLELLRQEVRAAREVVSPNVCRIFDLIEIDGRELVSMEYVDGATLLGVLQERGPLELKEAQDIASQFLAGLEAIHKAGLVHRDVKPENIMLTRAGRVVVMDFGLARGPESGAGSVSGTPAYMAPEHAAGLEVDARADVYSAGVVLAEMVSPEGIKSYESRQSVWEGVRSEPAQVPDSPWAPVIKRAVARDRERRQNSAHTLIRELEDVTLRVEGAEDLHPYPGLASFTEEDAEYFFGREAEVEQMWRKLEGPPRVLGIMGPSGAGKTSFIRAGLAPNAPPNWAIIRCTPGSTAIPSLRGALTPELTGGSEALLDLVTDPDNPDVIVDAVRTWRTGRVGALLIVDQFEELFTQHSKDDQRRFAALLGRLPLETDVHVVVSMRDDFAASCNAHEALHTVFHDLTVLQPPTGGNLRRALAQPAMKCGYRFEDDDLIEEILNEVEGERGALPLVAFALARLWEKRDRNSGLLTRQAYHDIGGVGGALARHAEATIDRIGVERIPIVRELFRNLVTAEGTRAVREWDELLSVFEGTKRESTKSSPTKKPQSIVGAGLTPAHETSEAVLHELIDARLLTSFEVREDEYEPIRRVEIIHESLLANWPRLVRWQTRDADASQLRDQLRQAAKTWDDQGRTVDTLWTGSAYREFELWRERYPGGLTEIEEAFAAAMTSFATRRRRHRRLAVSTGFVVMLLVLVVVGSFWRRSVLETRRAEAEAKRAEAQKLLALGELTIEDDPTEALAWARASLDVTDTLEGRLFALRALSKGPIARVIAIGGELGMAHDAVFSPDGEWVALRGYEQLNVYRRTGGGPVHTDVFPTLGEATIWPFFDPSNATLGASKAGEIRTYAVPGFAATATYEIDVGGENPIQTDRGVFFISSSENEGAVRWWRPGSPPELVTTTPPLGRPFIGTAVIDASGEWIAYVPQSQDDRVYLKSLIEPTSTPRLIRVHDGPIGRILLGPDLDWIALRGKESPTITVSPIDPEKITPLRSFPGRGLPLLSSDESRIIEGGLLDGVPTVFVWDLDLPAGVEPLELRWRRGSEYLNGIAIDPSGRWIAAGTLGRVPFWPLPEAPTMVFPGTGDIIYRVAFTPDSRSVVVPKFGESGVLVQPVGTDGAPRRLLSEFAPDGLAVDPRGQFVVASGSPGGAVIGPLDGSAPVLLEGLHHASRTFPVAIHPEQNLVAAGVLIGPAEHKVIGVWDLEEESFQTLGPAEDAGEGFWGGFWSLEFLHDGSLLSVSRENVLRRWNLDNGFSEVVIDGMCGLFGVRPDGETAVVGCLHPDGGGEFLTMNFTTGERHRIPARSHHTSQPAGLALSPQGDIFAIGFQDGTIQLWNIDGGGPWTLSGHEATVLSLAFSPDGRLLASTGQDGSVRVWPVPDLSKPPLQALSHDELLATLDSHTNLRVVRNPASTTGWSIDIRPFPGWETAPTW